VDENTKPEMSANDLFEALLSELKFHKPEERSEEARRYAVTITELEKVYAYYILYIGGGI